MNSAEALRLLDFALDDATPPPPPLAELQSGTMLGPYQLIERIGEGGFGVVWRAEQSTPIQRSVAIKVLRSGADSAGVVTRFRSELETLARMNHPGIAAVLDAGQTPTGEPYFVMELVLGDCITDHCEKQKLNLAERVALLGKVCGAIHHAHQKGVMHRDLKPSNVLITLVDGQPMPKVIDFGIARALDRVSDYDAQTLAGFVLGTPRYMAPERATPGADDQDIRVDVHGLGVLLFELLTGVTPLEASGWQPADSMLITLRRLADQDAPLMSKARRERIERLLPAPVLGILDLPVELDWIAARALEISPHDRYSTAAAMADDLAAFLRHDPVSARAITTGYWLRKFAQRHRPWVIAALVMGLMIVASSTVAIVSYFKEARAREAAEAAKQLAQSNEVLARKQFTAAQQSMRIAVEVLRHTANEIEQGRNAEAMRAALRKSRPLLNELTDQPELQIEMFDRFASLHETMGDFAEALELRKQELPLRERLHGPLAASSIATLSRIANAENEIGHHAQSADAYALLVSRYESAGKRETQAWFEAARTLASRLCQAGNTKLGLEWFERLMDCSTGKKRIGREDIGLLRSYADGLLHANDISSARDMMQRSLNLTQEPGSRIKPKSRALMLTTMARIERSDQQHATAAKIMGDAIAISKELTGPQHESMIDLYLTQARDFASARQWPQAHETLDQAASVINHIGHESSRDDLHTLRGEFFLDQKEFLRAAKEFEAALPLATRDRGPSGATDTRLMIARSYASAAEYPRAIEQLTLASQQMRIAKEPPADYWLKIATAFPAPELQADIEHWQDFLKRTKKSKD